MARVEERIRRHPVSLRHRDRNYQRHPAWIPVSGNQINVRRRMYALAFCLACVPACGKELGPEERLRSIRERIDVAIHNELYLDNCEALTETRVQVARDLKTALAAWERNPKDVATNFEIGYLLLARGDTTERQRRAPKAPDFSILPPGRSVEFDTLRWYYQEYPAENAQTLRTGEALLKLSPNDLGLIATLASTHTYSKDGDPRRALELCDRWLQMGPGAFMPYYYRVNAYDVRLLRDRQAGRPIQKSDLEQAIRWSETFLKVAPPEANIRTHAELRLKRLREQLRKLP